MDNGISSSLLKLNKNDNNTNIDDTSFYIKFKKKEKDKKNKIDQFVKFKPKNLSKKTGEVSLKGAENKVKSILSSFLRTMRNEEKKDKIGNKNPEIKILISKLSSKKMNSNKFTKEKQNAKKPFNPGDINHLNALNKFYNNIVKSKENDNSSHKMSIEGINGTKTMENNKYLNIKKYLSTSKLNQDYKDSKTIEFHDKFKSNISSNLPKNTINNNSKINLEPKYKSNLSINNYQSIDKSDIYSKVTDSLITSSGLNDNNKSIYDKKKNVLKTNSVNVLSIYQKKLILGDYSTDLGKNKTSNKTAKYKSSKNILLGPVLKSNKNITKKKSIFQKKKINKYNNTFLIEPKKNKEIINSLNKNKILEKKYSEKNELQSIKRSSAEYNISNKLANKLAIKVDSHKRKTFQFTRKDSLNNGPKKKLQKVEHVLKNLQEKLKNSIILRPEDLDLDINGTPRKKKTKKFKEIKASKKELLSSNLNLTNRKNSHNFSAIKDVNNNGAKSNLYDEDDKNKLQIPNNEIFKNSNSVSKNETELEALKSGDQELTSTQLPFLRNISQLELALEKYRVLTHKKMVYDSLDDEEIEDEVNDFFYINPKSKFSIIFDGILLFLTLYSMFDFPYYI